MKTSSVRFDRLRQVLTQMGFAETQQHAGWRYEHSPTGTMFLFRPYQSTDLIYEHDLFLVRAQLDGRGVMSQQVFNESLTKQSA